MKRSALVLGLIFLLGISFTQYVGAQDTSPKDPYSGDILSRSTLTGDWWGIRNQLADKGVTFDLSITQVGQGVVNGGKSGVWEYGGRGDTVMNVDSGKLGWWPGGFLNFELEGNWASSVNAKTGSLMPVNTNQMFPLPPGDIFGIPALNFTQFLSPYFGLSIGKLATITATSGDMNEFAHGKGDTQFMNMAFNFNPLIAFTVPYSTLGTGVVALPTKDPKEAIVTFFVMSANGKPTTSGFENLNGNAVVVAAEGRVRTNFFGLTGHQDFGTSFSNKKFTSTDQRLDDIVETRTLKPEKSSWNIWYNFDQYLYEPKKGVDRGVGLFGRLGVSDGNPNFMKFFGSFGVGGKGVFDSRPLDQFGLGYYYINIDNPKLQGLLQTLSFLRNEYGFEAYYNAALTPWLLLTPDIQVVRGAQKDKVTITQGPLGVAPRIDKKSIGTATVLGVRLQVLF
ncbi:MAG TPA: carbohydrate porin [Methylomirabilota bacterium]|nr:carbohydrate porin [Methylomirabilota bacterium]